MQQLTKVKIVGFKINVFMFSLCRYVNLNEIGLFRYSLNLMALSSTLHTNSYTSCSLFNEFKLEVYNV